MRVLLVYPPHTRNTEPPLGLGLLTADLNSLGIEARIVDLNALAAPYLALSAPVRSISGRRRSRAVRRVEESVRALRSGELYESVSRYRTALEYYAEALRAVCEGTGVILTPGDFKAPAYCGFEENVVREVAASRLGGFWDLAFEKFLAEELDSFDPKVVGVSITYRSQFLPAVCLCSYLKERRPEINLILGGAFLSSLPQETAAAWGSLFGPVVRGPGESPLRKLLGIPSRALPSFRDPDFTGVRFDAYFAPYRVAPISSSRGCYWRRCAFCAEAAVPFSMDDPKAFMGRLERLAKRYEISLFHFTDNAIPPAVLKELARCGSPAPWYGFVRAERILADQAFVEDLAASGCSMLQLGFETPVRKLLEKLRKGVEPELFLPITRTLRDCGIAVYVYLLFGLPGQGRPECEQSMALVEEAQPDFLNASVFRLPPQAEAAREPERFGIGEVGERASRDLYLQFRAPGMDLPDLRRWLSRRFYRSPAVRKAQAATPRYFKSSHAVFFTPKSAPRSAHRR